MLDAIIAGAGPAGTIAAIVLARAGARVLLLDREQFPRDKLCGDTLNPGAVRSLSGLRLVDGPLTTARPLAGMLVTGPGAAVEARYPRGIVGLALRRAVFDTWLLDEAVRAGARFESGLTVRGPLVDAREATPVVRGLVVSRRGSPDRELRLPASVTIAADGRRSVLARALGLTRHPNRARRWAFGVYADGIAGTTDLGEMHIRPGFYLGIAPLEGACSNVCLVTTPRPRGPRPIDLIRQMIARDRRLSERFEHTRFDSHVRVLGPLAVDARTAGGEGLFLAGDAGGFVDPMTGDGLHLAIKSAALAAQEALRVLEHGNFALAVERLDEARRTELAPKLRFNRALRAVTSSRAALGVGDIGARVVPGVIRWAVRYAGDAA